MEEKKAEQKTEAKGQKTYTNANVGVLVNGELFPIPMTLEEFDIYEKLLEEEKSNKE